MIKVLPLLIIPPIFLLLFLNVENLTVKIDSKFKSDSISERNNDNLIQNRKEEEVNISNENLSKKYDETKLDDSAKDSKPKLLKSNNSVPKKDLNNIQDFKIKNEIPKIKSKPTQISKNDSIKIQFGAFSKLKNAEIQKLKILGLLSAKFPGFEKKLRILEENNLFKIIYIAENLTSSQSICGYSKSIKINCLILKR